MTDRSLAVTAILPAGIGMGFAGDQLLRATGGPGLNVFLLFAGLAVSIWIMTRSSESQLSREASLFIGVGILFGAALMGRGSGLLRLGTFLAACAAFSLPALNAGRAWVRGSGIFDLFEALAGAGFHAVFGGVKLINRESWAEIGTDASRGAAGAVVRTALGGVLLALGPLVVFGALFISADEVFATIIGDFVKLDLETFGSHLVATFILSWLACGYLVGVTAGTRLNGIRRLLHTGPALGIAEVATALGLVDLLFLGFVIVQFRYLFGGGAWVEVTPGLSYAAYARAGFFQLVAAVGLAIPWLLVAHAVLADHGRKAHRVFVGFAGFHLLLILVIVASAIQRMLAYQAAYGLTEERVVVTAALLWLTVVVAWFGATVFSGRRDRFAFGGLVTAFVLLGALHFMNPAGMVARHNLDRMAELGGVDVEYLGRLGSDAAPLLVDRLHELSDEDQCSVAKRLLSRWGPGRPADWRSFNWSEDRARKAVAGAKGTLRRLSGTGGCG